MARPRTTFKNPETLQEMLRLRRKGWSFTKLGERYNCDHTTIMYHCQKNSTVIEPDNVLKIHKNAILQKVKDGDSYYSIANDYALMKWQVKEFSELHGVFSEHYYDKEKRGKRDKPKNITTIEGLEKINQGKMYEDYLQEEEDRKFRRLLK